MLWAAIVDFCVGIADWNPFYPYIPFHLIDFVGTFATCASYRVCMGKRKDPWQQVIVACAIGMYGGAFLLGLMLGQTPGWLNTADSPIAFLSGYWLVFCCPGDFPFWLITRNRSVELFFGYFRTLGQAHCFSTWGADIALRAHHVNLIGGSGPLTILSSFIASCGAGFMVTWLRLGGAASEWTFSTPPFLKAAGMEGRRALFFSCLYYALRNPHGFLPYSTEFVPKDDAKTLIWVLTVCNFTLIEFFRTDVTLLFSNLVGAACLCPAQVGGPLTNRYLDGFTLDGSTHGALPLGLSTGWGRQRSPATPRSKQSRSPAPSQRRSSKPAARRRAKSRDPDAVDAD